MTFAASYRFTAAELLAAHRLHVCSGTEQILRYVILVFAVLFLLSAIVVLGVTRPVQWIACGAFAALGLLCIRSSGYSRRICDVLFRKRTDCDETKSFVFSDEGVEWSDGSGTVDLEWSDFIAARCASDAGLLLYKNYHSFAWVPASAFADSTDFARLCTLVASKVPIFQQVDPNGLAGRRDW